MPGVAQFIDGNSQCASDRPADPKRIPRVFSCQLSRAPRRCSAALHSLVTFSLAMSRMP